MWYAQIAAVRDFSLKLDTENISNDHYQPDLQTINAVFSALLTVMMMCRLMLNLRSDSPEEEPGMRTIIAAPMSQRNFRFRDVDTYVGYLGNELDIDDEDIHEEQGRGDRERARMLRKERDYELSTFYSSGPYRSHKRFS